MSGLDIRTEYLDIECLADRWKCKIGLIEVLAETGQIKCCIRPAALKAAIESDRPHTPTDQQIPLQHYLDQEDIYRLFNNRTSPQKIDSYRKIIPDAPEIYILFSDLIVYRNTILEYEQRHRKYLDTSFEIQANDFTCVIWHGKEIKFGVTQGKIIEILWKAREAGEPWVYGKRLLTAVGSEAERLRGLFRHHKYWKELILSDYRGKYKLNLPPKKVLNGGINLVQ